MIGHILLAALATWITLALLVHVALFAVGFTFGQCRTFTTLQWIGFWTIAPVFGPLYALWRRYRKMRRAYRLGMLVLKAFEMDMRSLPVDEQRTFIERLRNDDEDRAAVVRDALARVREQREATR